MRAIDAIVMTFALDVLDKVTLSILNPADRAVAVLLAGLRHFKLALFINQVFERNWYLTFFLFLFFDLFEVPLNAFLMVLLNVLEVVAQIAPAVIVD